MYFFSATNYFLATIPEIYEDDGFRETTLRKLNDDINKSKFFPWSGKTALMKKTVKELKKVPKKEA